MIIVLHPKRSLIFYIYVNKRLFHFDVPIIHSSCICHMLLILNLYKLNKLFQIDYYILFHLSVFFTFVKGIK